ncbi:pentatricopeptide repeat-containing protein At1g63070, mitochondrial [Dendrobium catenatum]|uniref:Pentatricopeptide repeat-containing protein n=1 Tax=Dendrobium catenatum TaxID=906689 RepID=A0A2I0WFW3_9ASPA|nr:pentatricopeptide repeat-containing protein At1g63070, mitochondrial [Dendrobium catenatum]PKU74555.1 Pentatricopeptide repeat-containing protein [Dendrobium catenatum]
MPYISVSPYYRLRDAAAVRLTLSAAPPARHTLSSDYLSLFRSAVFSFSRRPKLAPSRFPPSCPLSHSSNEPTAAGRRFLRHLFRPSTASYNALMNSLLLANHTAAASSTFSSLLSSGLSLTTSSFTIFLKLILTSPRANRFDDAYSLLDKMLHFGPLPDAITYSTFIAALSRAGRVSEAIGVLDLMLDNKCSPTPQACTSLIHGYCSQGKIKEAKHFMGLIESYGFAPDTYMYTVLIDALSRSGEFDEVERILGESQVKGWKPDEVTYNVYMNGLCKAGRVGEAFGLLDAMRCNGLFPSLETLNILFDCLCRVCKLQEAVELLGKSAELDWSPDVIFYNTMISRCLDRGWSTNVLRLLSDMVKRGIEPDACTLTLIIRSMFSDGKLQLAKYMMNGSRSFVPDVVAFNTLLHHFYLFGENKEVINLFADMVQKNVTPNKFTYCVLIDSLYKEERIEEAIDVVLGTIRDDFMQDLISRLLRWLAGGQKFGDILKLFQKLGQDSIIDVACFNSLIISCCKMGICRSQDFYRLSIIIEQILGIM